MHGASPSDQRTSPTGFAGSSHTGHACKFSALLLSRETICTPPRRHLLHLPTIRPPPALVVLQHGAVHQLLLHDLDRVDGHALLIREAGKKPRLHCLAAAREVWEPSGQRRVVCVVCGNTGRETVSRDASTQRSRRSQFHTWLPSTTCNDAQQLF